MSIERKEMDELFEARWIDAPDVDMVEDVTSPMLDREIEYIDQQVQSYNRSYDLHDITNTDFSKSQCAEMLSSSWLLLATLNSWKEWLDKGGQYADLPV